MGDARELTGLDGGFIVPMAVDFPPMPGSSKEACMSVRKHHWSAAIALGIGIALSGSAAWAAMIEIVKKDGTKFLAEMVSQTPASVTVKISGIEQTIPRDQIESMQVKQTLAEEFDSRRAALKNDDFAGRYDLARQFLDKGGVEAMKLALAEAQSMLRDKPEDARTKLLVSVIEGRLRGAEKPAEGKSPSEPTKAMPPAPTPATPTPTPAPPPSAAAAKGAPTAAPRQLTKEEINLIRVYEVDLEQDRASIPPLPAKAVGDLIDKYQNQPAMSKFLGPQGAAMFRKLDGADQLKIAFELQAREMYGQFIVRRDPPQMQKFTQEIHGNFVVRYCGSCHGEGKAPGLYLFTKNPTGEQTIYTNYMLLRRTSTRGFPLIYKQEPKRSPLLHYGLPETATTEGHPKSPGYRPYFTRGVEDPNYQRVLEWITAIYGTGNEDYPISFAAPVSESPAPASAPQAAPDAKK
jgi:hypothetical protein